MPEFLDSVEGIYIEQRPMVSYIWLTRNLIDLELFLVLGQKPKPKPKPPSGPWYHTAGLGQAKV